MGVGMAVRRRTHPCTHGAWLMLLLLLHAGLAGAPADFVETRWLFAYKTLTSCRAIFRPRKAVPRRTLVMFVVRATPVHVPVLAPGSP